MHCVFMNPYVIINFLKIHDYLYTLHKLELRIISYFTAPDDYSSVVRMVTFSAGQTVANVSVPITDDLKNEDIEMFTASLNTSEENVIVIEDTANITIIDDDGKVLDCLKLSPTITVRSLICQLLGNIAIYYRFSTSH